MQYIPNDCRQLYEFSAVQCRVVERCEHTRQEHTHNSKQASKTRDDAEMLGKDSSTFNDRSGQTTQPPGKEQQDYSRCRSTAAVGSGAPLRAERAREQKQDLSLFFCGARLRRHAEALTLVMI